MLYTIQQLDGNLLINIQHLLVHDWLTPFMSHYTVLGDAGIIWIVISVLLLAFSKTRKIGITALLALVLMHVSVNEMIKPLVGRTRPYDVFDGVQLLVHKQHDFSFPSGHTTAAFAASYVYYRMAEGKQTRFAIVAIAASVLMGISRLYVGVHYPGDVLFGMCWGLLCGWAACYIADKFCERKAVKSK